MRNLVKSLLAAGLFTLALVAPAQAAFGLKEFNSAFINEDETPATKAGTHPFAQLTSFSFNTVDVPNPDLEELPDRDVKDLVVSLPPGFVGDPTAIPPCSSVQFSEEKCSAASQVGRAEAFVAHPDFIFDVPLYSIVTPPGQVLRMGFHVVHVPVTIDLRVNPEPPFNVLASTNYTSNALPIYGTKLIIPGVSDGATKPFLTLPRACTGPLGIRYEARSWQEPNAPVFGTGQPVTMSGCEQLDFGPTVSGKPTNSAAESPSGIDFDIDIDDPGLTEIDGTADSDIKKTVVTLPEGITTNPAIASGLEVCSLAQFEAEGPIDSNPATGCPEASKVGRVDVTTPLLDEALEGSVYVAKQGDNPFKSLLAIYVVIKNPKLGISVRLAGKVEPDPGTGRLTTTFDDMPQFPVGHLRFHFQGGDRAPLITPPTCGSYEATADLYPYSDPNVPLRRTVSFQIDSPAGGSGPCPTSISQLPHSPRFSAGTLSPKAGAFSPFVFKLDRADGSQHLSAISTTLPKGLVASLAGIPYCSDAQIAVAQSRSAEGQGALELAQPSCPAASRIGTVSAGAGAGPHPYYVSGSAYLAGPYKGAPLSVEIVTPALAGPFDLGVVAVRTALYLDPETTIVKAVSDPLPTILHGLPLDVRSVALQMDRPSFTLNPTSCEPSAITGTATSTLGVVSPLSSYFQASDCGALGFKPKLKLALKGGTKRNDHPALHSTLTARPGDANIGKAVVTLPRTEFIDNAHIQNPCTRVQFKANQCPKGSVLGTAKATSPLLDAPLQGPVYFRSNGGERLLPDIVADLNGQIHVTLVGFVDAKKGRIRTTFQNVPDAPVAKFTIDLYGGKRGLLVNSTNLCAKERRAKLALTAQNGAQQNTEPVVKTNCKKQKSKKQKKR
ncbi:MAG TPA: hypothetical protein VEW07_07875 [Solirubrobacterales bacterium]|nr:hypothetical protein [Solirubrobacterales bacterium]